jgi:DNA processing protein
MNDFFERLLILRTPNIGAVKYFELIQKFGSPAAAAESLQSDVALVDAVRREMDLAARLNIQYICDDDMRYPEIMRAVKDHPPVISVRGRADILNMPCVGMVGTRNATGAGIKFMSELAGAFAEHGYCVASGMAMGTDTAAHVGALRANGATIAVLAGGADYIWPLENESLYYKILEQGAIISRMPVGYKPCASNFVQRNRGIAALGQKLILGEADLKSGSMATAGFAIEYGRPIYAIPSHPSDPRSAGPNRLIKEGNAILCEGAMDFFADCRKATAKENKKPQENNDVLSLLGIIPQSESVLAELAKKSITEIKGELIALELHGLIRKCDGGYVKK